MTQKPALPLAAGRTLALLGIVLVALNLRTAVGALSPIFDFIGEDFSLGSVGIGVLGMLPPIFFAVFGICAPMLHRRFGLEPVLIVALVALVLGHLIRACAPDYLVLAVASALTFAGMGIGNVLLPPLVKKYFPDRIGAVTSLYATVMSIGATIPPLIAVPVAIEFGWRTSVGAWALFAVLALIPWCVLALRRTTTTATDVAAEEADPEVLGRIWHSKLAWALMAIFAITSLNAYAMFGWLPEILVDISAVTPAAAGVLMSVFAFMGLPAAIIVPPLAARFPRVPGLLLGIAVVFFLTGYGGLILMPTLAPWLWVVLIGLGPLTFPLSLTLINLRTRTHQGAVALSGFVQGVGYAISALGPFLVGVLHEVAGHSWNLALLFLVATALALIPFAIIAATPRMVEDEIGGTDPQRQ